jgi:RimJ/RimL family protein N-acetyltransferase
MNPIKIPEIETERLGLRQATTNDLEDWAARIFADPDVIRFMPKRDMTPYARAERALNNYNRLWEQHKIGGWVVKDKINNQLIGSCEIEYLDETDEYELGYCYAKTYWGKGIASEAARAVVRYGFETAGLERIIAVVVPENKASWRALEHIGFAYEKMANYYDLDVVFYMLTRDQYQADDSFYRVIDPQQKTRTDLT